MVCTFAALYKIKQYMIKQRLLTALLMGGIIATGAYAQAEKGDSDDMTKKTHELNPVVVTGTGTHQRG
jgi:outer membrane receptor for ferrienterochelin and colicins